MKFASVVFVFLLLASAGRANGQQASKEDFKEYCQAVEGRWIGEVTWIADWPGIGKKGDKVTCYTVTTIESDGHTLVSRFLGGGGTFTGITVYDASKQQIRGLGSSSGGTVFHTILYKKDGKWMEVITGSNPDGAKITAKNMLQISKDGKTHTWTGTTTIDGEEVDKLHDVWKRVSK